MSGFMGMGGVVVPPLFDFVVLAIVNRFLLYVAARDAMTVRCMPA